MGLRSWWERRRQAGLAREERLRAKSEDLRGRKDKLSEESAITKARIKAERDEALARDTERRRRSAEEARERAAAERESIARAAPQPQQARRNGLRLAKIAVYIAAFGLIWPPIAPFVLFGGTSLIGWVTMGLFGETVGGYMAFVLSVAISVAIPLFVGWGANRVIAAFAGARRPEVARDGERTFL